MTEAVEKKGGAGRPAVLTPDICRKMEEAAALGASVEEMAYYVGIHRSTVYRWMKEDPELNDRIEELRIRPVLLARRTVVDSLSDPNMAWKYLERKRPNEFRPSSKVEVKEAVSDRMETNPKFEAIRVKYEVELRALLAGPEEVCALEEKVCAIVFDTINVGR